MNFLLVRIHIIWTDLYESQENLVVSTDLCAMICSDSQPDERTKSQVKTSAVMVCNVCNLPNTTITKS